MTALPAFIEKKKKLRLPQPKLLTYEDYARITPPDSGNYELHHGKIVFMPSPIDIHQEVVGVLHVRLFLHVSQNGLGKVYLAPLDTIFNPIDTFQPDLLFIAKDRLHIVNRQVRGAPDLIIEVLSDGNTTKEMSYKKHVYETSGVKEYWLINLRKQVITQYENIDGEFFVKNVVNTEGVLKSIVVEGFEIKVSDIFP